LKLSERTLEELAKMVVGDAEHFPYRSSYYITKFFARCGLPFKHDGTTRPIWAAERLKELNIGSAQSSDLPSDDLCRVISEMFDPDDFDAYNNKSSTGPQHLSEVTLALDSFNKLVKRYGIVAYLDDSDRCYLRSTGTGISTESFSQKTRPLSAEELAQRQKLATFLDTASEDEFIEKMLVPLFQRLGFSRVSPTGHKEKALEFGKDLWMTFRLPTSHWLYFCAQVKKDKIDSSGTGGSHNVATVLTQARMAIDHLFLISAGEITRGARTFLVENLDAGQRRHIIFMDRDEFLDQSARILLDLRIEEPKSETTEITDDDIPF
jgi:Restriction endonuclease